MLLLTTTSFSVTTAHSLPARTTPPGVPHGAIAYRTQRPRSPSPTLVAVELEQATADRLRQLGLVGNYDNIWLDTAVTAEKPLSETLPEGANRIVESGRGTLSVGGETYPLKKDTVITVVDGPAEMVWSASGDEELVLLLSEYWSPPRVFARTFAAPIWALMGLSVFAGNFLSGGG